MGASPQTPGLAALESGYWVKKDKRDEKDKRLGVRCWYSGDRYSWACLGVRHRGNGLAQLYYICPVKCAIISGDFSDDQVQLTSHLMSVKRKDLETTEIAVEYGKYILSEMAYVFANNLSYGFFEGFKALSIKDFL